MSSTNQAIDPRPDGITEAPALRGTFAVGIGRFAWPGAMLAGFAATIVWFDAVDPYHHHFYDRGSVVLADNLVRIAFLPFLAWLIYAPGAAVAAWLWRAPRSDRGTPAERAIIGFGIGTGLWQIVLLTLGIAGLYYRMVMAGLAVVVLLASARHFTDVAVAATARVKAWLNDRPLIATPEHIGGFLVILAAVWLLMVRGLYPGGGGDYYTHYFYYYLDVLKSHGLAPNEVWYHYYYSKGYGLFYFGMLLTDPEAPALVTFCFVIATAVAIAVLVHRLMPGTLWGGCAAALYLAFNLVSRTGYGGGEFQKDHEQVSALIALIVCALCLAYSTGRRAWWAAAVSSVVAVAIIAQPLGVIIGIYFLLASAWALIWRRRSALIGNLAALFAAGGTVAAMLGLGYWQTGLPSDQAFDLMLRFADIAKLDRWGVLPQLVIVAWIRDNYLHGVQSWAMAFSRLLRAFMSLDQLCVFLAGIACMLVLVGVRLTAVRMSGRVTRFTAPSPSPDATLSTVLRLASLIAVLAIVSAVAGRPQPVSFLRTSTFFVPLLLLLGASIGAWATSRMPTRGEYRLIGVVVPGALLIATAAWWQSTDWHGRLGALTANGVRFLTGRYSLAEAYQHQDATLPGGGINPHVFEAWRHVEPGAPIWSMGANAYCMAPGCRIESLVSFTLSPHLDEIVAGAPDRAKALLQQAGMNYFLISSDIGLIDLLPYSRLFAPDTIGRYLGIKWTDGTAYLLSWLGPETTALTPEFFRMYGELRARPEHPWFRFSQLAPQIEAATQSLRAKPFGAAAQFAWRIPETAAPDGTIDIDQATYGWNCRGSVSSALFSGPYRGNATDAVRKACNGKTECAFRVSVEELSDPAGGCAKDFSLSYRCHAGEPLRKLMLAPEANGKAAALSCGPRQ